MGDIPEKKGDADEEIPICDFPDLRNLRRAYLKKDDLPIELDSNDNPRPDTTEEDFGLRRSTAEEAWEFFRAIMEAEDGPDDLTEFLNDDD